MLELSLFGGTLEFDNFQQLNRTRQVFTGNADTPLIEYGVLCSKQVKSKKS